MSVVLENDIPKENISRHKLRKMLKQLSEIQDTQGHIWKKMECCEKCFDKLRTTLEDQQREHMATIKKQNGETESKLQQLQNKMYLEFDHLKKKLGINDCSTRKQTTTLEVQQIEQVATIKEQNSDTESKLQQLQNKMDLELDHLKIKLRIYEFIGIFTGFCLFLAMLK